MKCTAPIADTEAASRLDLRQLRSTQKPSDSNMNLPSQCQILASLRSLSLSTGLLESEFQIERIAGVPPRTIKGGWGRVQRAPRTETPVIL